jgi:hypothetical protein
VFNDWASKEFGVLAITTEMWAHEFGEGQDALFRWNDEVLGGRGYIDWYPFTHPDLGRVELGGWDRWSTSSPPEPLIAGELEQNVKWVLTFADKTPQVAILEASAAAVEGGADARITAQVANVGWMATATAHARDALRTAVPVRARLELENATVVTAPVIDLGVLPGTGGGRREVKDVSWTVRVTDPTRPAHVTIVVSSEKAGTVRRVVSLPR